MSENEHPAESLPTEPRTEAACPKCGHDVDHTTACPDGCLKCLTNPRTRLADKLREMYGPSLRPDDPDHDGSMADWFRDADALAEAAQGAAPHPRTYSLVGSGLDMFLVTDDESGFNIGYARKIGGPITRAAPHDCPLPSEGAAPLPHQPVKRIRNRQTEERCIVDGEFWPCRSVSEGAAPHKHDPVTIPRGTNAFCATCGYFPLPLDGARTIRSWPEGAAPRAEGHTFDQSCACWECHLEAEAEDATWD